MAVHPELFHFAPRNRGRDTSCPMPPAQIPACGIPAPGSSDELASVKGERDALRLLCYSPHVCSHWLLRSFSSANVSVAGYVRLPESLPLVAGSPVLRVLSVSMTSIRSSGLPHLRGLSGPTNFRLNRMDLPCSRQRLWLHAGGTNPGRISGRSL